MTPTLKSPARLTAAFVLGGLLAACGGPDLTGVRGGPQAVHPSPSGLAQGTAVKLEAACHSHGYKSCHTHGNDGSSPIHN